MFRNNEVFVNMVERLSIRNIFETFADPSVGELEPVCKDPRRDGRVTVH